MTCQVEKSVAVFGRQGKPRDPLPSGREGSEGVERVLQPLDDGERAVRFCRRQRDAPHAEPQVGSGPPQGPG